MNYLAALLRGITGELRHKVSLISAARRFAPPTQPKPKPKPQTPTPPKPEPPTPPLK